ncbi:MAG: hypothetical protein WC563_15675 [Brevundimonas sp.]
MANYAEITRTNDGNDSVDVMCYSALAISAGYAVNYETVAGYSRAVKLPTASTDRTAGVTVTDIAAGGYGLVCIHGPVVMYGHEPIATGEHVEVGLVALSMGEAIIGVATTTHQLLGFCLQPCVADGDKCEVFVNIQPICKAA